MSDGPRLEGGAESARRWQTRQVEREEQRSAIEEGLIASVEPPERIQKRLDRLAAAAVGRKGSAGGPGPRAGRPQAGLVETIGLERVLGKADFLGMDFLETALAVSRFVGRINFRTRPGRTEGFGTGFMVSPRLLLTNNHVLRTKGDALYSEVEFDYQYDRHDRLLPVVVYGLEPETFFLTSRELDFTLVAVRESSLSGIGIGRYGWSPLIGAEGKCLLGDPLNVVQHPKGEAKQIVLRSNQLVDLFGDFAHYVADTEPGSSGSPIYNDEWEVVCSASLRRAQDGGRKPRRQGRLGLAAGDGPGRPRVGGQRGSPHEQHRGPPQEGEAHRGAGEAQGGAAKQRATRSPGGRRDG